MNDTERLSIERACMRLITQYAYLNDERNYDALVQLFAEDAVLCRPSAPDQEIVGRAAILEAFKKRPADTATFHVCSDMLIDVVDARTAHARSRILMLSTTLRDGVPGEAKTPVPGTFRDRLQLTEEGWKFAERRGSFWVRT